MSDNAKNQSISQSASSEPSAARRKLLRAAAVSAPFIATLPTNLAAQVANASTSQCLVSARAESDEQDTTFDAADSPDKWVRITADHVTIQKGDRIRQYYAGSDPFNGNAPFCYVGERWDVNKEANAKSLGEEITMDYIDNLKTNRGWSQVSKTRKNVLVMFTEGEDNGFIKGLEHQGMYPNKQRTTNTGAVNSCLCSVDPDYRNTHMCS